MALSFPLDSTAVGQADDVFYCLNDDPPDVVDGRRVPISGTSQTAEDKQKRADWVALYEAILAHKNNKDGSKPFPACKDTDGHTHHPADCVHCLDENGQSTEEETTDDDQSREDDRPDDICEECQKAYLVVVVKDEDGNPVEGATVNVDGLYEKTTTAEGEADYGEVPAGVYNVTADKDGHGPSSSGGVGESVKVGCAVPAGNSVLVPMVQHPVLKVTIAFTAAVACPGHPYEMKASGTPTGGTYEWTVTGHDARVSKTAGGPVGNTGDTVYMQCFKPDDTTGGIPERKVDVKVIYTHPTLGTVTATAVATVHEITFGVKNQKPVMGGIMIREVADSAPGAGDGGAVTENSGGIVTMECDPKIKINIGASCPRKDDCAQNHEAGWLQTMLTDTRQGRYSETLFTNAASTSPIRDAITGTPAPWYDLTGIFLGDGDEFVAHHEDSPSQPFVWRDRRADPTGGTPIANRDLRTITYENSFQAWLVVRNDDYERVDSLKSFVYVRNFHWSCGITATVDMTKANGSRCSPSSKPAKAKAVGVGKGSETPILDGPIWNDDQQQTFVAAPALP